LLSAVLELASGSRTSPDLFEPCGLERLVDIAADGLAISVAPIPLLAQADDAGAVKSGKFVPDYFLVGAAHQAART
jgi:hypothetical protein